ncbi:unnamed protein product, partial [Staurois parvus]
TQTTAGKSHHCGRGRDTNYCRKSHPLWEGQRHKLLRGNLTIVGGAETQTTVQGNLTIVGGAETQTTAGKSHHCVRGRDTNYCRQSHHCGRGRDTNYCREISPLWEGQRHKLLQE